MNKNRLHAEMPEDALRTALNAECGKLEWPELEKHFARGVVIKVGAEVDLIDVAVAMIKDDKATINEYLQQAKIVNATTQDALRWNAGKAFFWAVVVSPWVVVQEVKAAS